MTTQISCNVLIVGGGPGGYVAALRAAQRGLGVVLVEAADLGGTCLNRGCIPSKALLHASERFASMRECADGAVMGLRCQGPEVDMPAMMRWKGATVEKLSQGVASLLAARGVRVLMGWATFENAKTCAVSGDNETWTVNAENVVLATGSVSAPLPSLEISGNVLTSAEALELDAVPASMLVVGAGYIGLELATVFARLGCRMHIVEAGDRMLPGFAPALVKPVADWFADRDVEVALSSRVEGVRQDGTGCITTVRDVDGNVKDVASEKVLVAIGRRPCTAGWGLENMAVDMAGAFIKVDDQCRTSMRGVWAIGDLVGEPMLAHKASAQGELVAEVIAGGRRRFKPLAIPTVCYTEPEIVSVGMCADDARREREAVSVGRFSFAANGRALSAGADVGFVEVVAREDDRVVIGIHAVGKYISELAGEFALAVEMQARMEDIAATIHAHPTMGEGLMEASFQGLGAALHVA